MTRTRETAKIARSCNAPLHLEKMIGKNKWKFSFFRRLRKTKGTCRHGFANYETHLMQVVQTAASVYHEQTTHFFISRRASETEKKQTLWQEPKASRTPPQPLAEKSAIPKSRVTDSLQKKDRNWRCVWMGDRTRKPVMMSSHSSHLPQLQLWSSFSEHAQPQACHSQAVWKLMQTQAQTHQKWRPSLQRRTLQNIRPPPKIKKEEAKQINAKKKTWLAHNKNVNTDRANSHRHWSKSKQCSDNAATGSNTISTANATCSRVFC